jgi:hypothetical protein
MFVVPMLILAACTTSDPIPSPTPVRIVDGVELGAAVGCPSAAGCQIIYRVAIEWLDKIAPGHPAVRAIDLFVAVTRDTNGDVAYHVGRSGSAYATVLALEDGTERATIVGCGLNTCWREDPLTVDPP